jgi:hypothetical protein
MKYILSLLLLLSLNLHAQNRQLLYKLDNSAVTVTDSKEDPDGNLIHVGYTGVLPVIFKTDADGNVLWSRIAALPEHRMFVKVSIAANGDYLAVAKGSFGSLLRIDKNGNTKWYKYIGYSNTINETFNGVTELPNGNIAICGTNDFDYNGMQINLQYQGYLIIADSAGNFLDFKVYGHTQSNIDDQYYFNSLTASGNRIYIVGQYNKKVNVLASNKSLLLTTDLSGNLVSTRLMSDTLLPDNQLVHNLRFGSVSVQSGRLVIGGAGQVNATGQVVPFVIHTDTTAGPASLKCILSGPVLLSEPQFMMRDTGDIYCVAMQPVPFSSYAHNAYVTRLHNGTSHTRRYYQDSAYYISSIGTSGGNNVVLSGYYPSEQAGYTGIHNDTLPSSMLCGVSDTAFQVYAFPKNFTAPASAPLVALHALIEVNMQLQASCVYEWHLCGDTVCREDFAARFTLLTDTALCQGDTFRLFSPDCYPKAWLRNDTLFEGGTGNYLESTVSGNYRLAITNNACFDTASIRATIYPIPEPHVTQQGDSLVCNIEDADAYQWYNSEDDLIPGATGRYFQPSDTGAHKVAVTRHGCTGFSDLCPYDGALGIIPQGSRKPVLQLFPNPASDMVKVYNPSRSSQLLSFYSLDGRPVTSVTLEAGWNHIAVNNTGLRAGMYMAVLVTPSGIYRQKLTLLP